MNCTVNELISHCEEAINKGVKYIYGAKWQVLTKAQIDALRNRYGSNCVWNSDSNKAGQICCDCSGLISSATGIVRGSSQYKSTATECHPISERNASMRGWAVWENGHIGIYDGNDGYYAMDGSARNAVHYPLSRNTFTHIIKLCDVKYDVTTSPASQETPQASGGFYNDESNNIDIEYAVMIEGGRILPFVKNFNNENGNGFAGLPGYKIVGVAIRSSQGTLDYGITTVDGKEYPIVHGCDWNDNNNGWAGDGKRPVATLKAYLHSPHGDKCIYFRLAPVGRDYFDWQRDMDKGNGMDGYGGSHGVPNDRLQMYAK